MLKNMRYLLFCLLLPVLAPAHADIYRSVDKDGNVVFSDQPSEGAKKIEVQDAQTIKLPPAGKFKYQPPATPPAPRYTGVAVVQPADDQPVRQNDGNITVQVSVTPALKSGDVVSLLMDGKEVASGPATSFTLKNVDRGSHTLQARVQGSDGKVWSSSTSVTFHLLRHSIIKPQAAPPPPPKPPSN